MSEKEKENLLKQINKLTPMEFSKLCVKIVKKIVGKPVDKTIGDRIHKDDKEILIKLMIEKDIKIDGKEKNNE